MNRYVFITILIILVNFKLFSGVNDSLKTIKYKIILKNGESFLNSTPNLNIYLVSSFGRLRFGLAEFDSIEIGVLPDFKKEDKIIRILKGLEDKDKKIKDKSYEKILMMKISALPIIRNYLDYSGYNKNEFRDKYCPVNVFEELLKKYNLERDFLDIDIVYLNQNFKLGGYVSVKKKRAILRFNKLIFPRDEVKKIILLH